MPRRRSPKVWPEKVSGAIESMIPGTLGGRMSNAGPVSDQTNPAVEGSGEVLDDSPIESVNTVSASGSALTLSDVTTATMHDVTLTANCTLTFPAAGAGKSFRVLARQDGTGSRVLVWPSEVDWPGGVVPTLSTDADAVDLLRFRCFDGSRWLGLLDGLDFGAAPAYISDNFNRADSTLQADPPSDGGAHWTIDNVWNGSQFNVFSNQAILSSGGSSEDHARRDTGIADVDMTITVIRAAETSYDQIWFGRDLSGNGTGYFLQPRYLGDWRIYRVDNYTTWSITQIDGGALATSTFASGQAVVRIVRNATTGDIDVYQDGTHLGTVNDTTYLTGTWVGFGSTADNESAFENFSALAS